jgi:hypothetical protein
MGNSSAKDKPDWDLLDIDNDCWDYPERQVGSPIDMKLVDGKIVHTNYLCTPNIAKLRVMFPKTYELAKKLYDKKVAMVYDRDRTSNNLPLDSPAYDNYKLCYRMPSKYLDIEQTFNAEFDEKYRELQKQNNRERAKKAQEFIDKILN